MTQEQETKTPPCPGRADGKHAFIVGNKDPYCFVCGFVLRRLA